MTSTTDTPPEAALARLQQMLMAGDFETALGVAQELAAAYPGHARVANMEGLALMQTGRIEPALSAFARANAADPGFAGAYLNRAALLLASGRAAEAAPICEQALDVVSGPAEVAKANYLLGAARAQSGAIEAAEAPYRAAIAAAPDMMQAHGGLGGVLAATGRIEAAVAVLEPAAARWPDAVDLARNLGTALCDLGQFGKAVDALRAAAAQAPGDPALQLSFARALRGAGSGEAALAAAEAAVAAAPKSVEAHGLVGSCLRDLGDTEGAIAAYDRALAVDPGDPTALIARWRITPMPKDHPARARIEALLADPATAPAHRGALELVLFAADDAAGDVASAAAHLLKAGKARRAVRPYDISQQARMFAALHTAFAAPVASLTPDRAAPVRPVFIVGMPRSGTSLVEQILASHPDVFGAGELPALGRAMAAAGWGGGRTGSAATPEMLGDLRGAYLGALQGLGAAEPVITDKTPMNFRWLGFALAAIPEARALVMRRDARATCFSNLTHALSGAANDFGADMVDTAEMFRLHLDLVDHWRHLYPDRVTVVPYERLTEDPEAESRKLVAAAGLDWDPACLAFHETRRAVRTASADQVRRPIYRGSSEAWRRYEAHLGPMLARLEGL